jgi:hypothetical protein
VFTASGEMRFRHGSTSPTVTWVRLCALAADEMGGKPEPSPHVLEFCGCMRSAARGVMEHFLLGLLRLLPVVPLSKSHEVNFPSRPRVRSLPNTFSGQANCFAVCLSERQCADEIVGRQEWICACHFSHVISPWDLQMTLPPGKRPKMTTC